MDYSHLVPCICVKDKLDEERRQYLVSWCEMPEHAREMTIAKFVVRKGLEEAYRAAKDMAEAAPATAGWLTFQSPTNRGKTHLACAICNRWLERGVPARYAYVPALLDELRRGFRNGGDGTYDDRFQQFLSVPLLLLDDLGQENQTNWVQERLDAIVDYRLMHRLPLVVTTMYHMRELPASISSRLDRAGRIITIDAPGFSPPRH